MKQIGNGIKEVHDQGYAHRNIKSENILIYQAYDNGKTQEVYKICDFGTIKKKDDLKTYQIGTAYYLAPEQLNGQDAQYSQKVDIWAFGVLIYELLTGEQLFKGCNEQEVWFKIKSTSQTDIDQNINQNLRIERRYKTLLLNMLQIDIKKRYDIDQVVSNLGGQSQIRSFIKFQGMLQITKIFELPQPKQLTEPNDAAFYRQYQNLNSPNPCHQGRTLSQNLAIRTQSKSPFFVRQPQIIIQKEFRLQPQNQKEQKQIQQQQGKQTGIQNLIIGQSIPKQQIIESNQNFFKTPNPFNNRNNEILVQQQQNVSYYPQNCNQFITSSKNNRQQVSPNHISQNFKKGDNYQLGYGNAQKCNDYIGTKSTFGNQNLQLSQQNGSTLFLKIEQFNVRK